MKRNRKFIYQISNHAFQDHYELESAIEKISNTNKKLKDLIIVFSISFYRTLPLKDDNKSKC